MSATTIRIDSRFPAPPAEPAATERAWEVLEHLVADLRGCTQPAAHIRLTLRAILDGSKASAVCWYAGATDELAHVVGAGWFTRDLCRDVVGPLAATAAPDEDQVLRRLPPNPGLDRRAQPRYAALIRLSR